MTLQVSVVIAAYNRGARIASTLDSVLRQGVRPLEIVVIDDESTDDTADWIRHNYPAVSVFTSPNGGTSLARNRGAERARGDVLVFLDHDDELLPHAIETLTTLLARFTEARAAFSDHQYVDRISGAWHANHHSEIPAFKRLQAIPALRGEGSARLYDRALHDAMLRGNLLQQPWAIYRSDFLELGGFDRAVKYCEDWELYLRVTASRRIVLSDDVISIHVVEGENLHRAAGQDVQHMKVIRKHLRLNQGVDQRAVRVLRRRLANYYKTLGDRRKIDGRPGAWNLYLRSFATWPWDAVVAARCLTWSGKGLVETFRSEGAAAEWRDLP